MPETILTKEKLFAYLIIDDIQVEEELLNNAKNDDGDSLDKIADIYYNRKDYVKAIDWYRLSAAQNHPHAQFQLGYMYRKSLGVAADYKFTMEWYLKSHKNGYISATNGVGYLYHNGFGVPQDSKIAIKWYLEAANRGLKKAQCNVGRYYEYGRGANKNKRYALEWYEKSAEQGYEKAKCAIERLNKEGFYINDQQKRYIQIERDNNEMKNKIKTLEEEKLTLSKAKENLETKSRLLEQEIKLLKLDNSVRGNEKTNKVKLDLNDIKIVKAEENPENDIDYDE